METNNIITKQILNNRVDDDFSLAQKYYAFISVINNLGLTKKELQLISFTAIKGNITYGNVRNEFCTKYKTTPATIGNMVCRLTKLKILIKDKGLTKVNPVLAIDFTKDLKLEINFLHE